MTKLISAQVIELNTLNRIVPQAPKKRPNKLIQIKVIEGKVNKAKYIINLLKKVKCQFGMRS